MTNINENTPFVTDGQPLGISMLDFWKYQYSNIYDMQEYIAEFLVGKALGLNEPCNRDGWTLWDIDYRGKRIEIKETSYYHSWQEKIAQGRISQQRSFGITPAYTKYKDSTTVLERQNDIYVFCLNTGNNEEESNPLEISNWEFYVVPTAVINANCTPAQKSISLGKVRKLAPMTRYSDLKNVIDSICDR
ncbi:MAG: hypothetical protein UD961_03840 [Bacteroidales bacterium]|nr:hypothetical protein [Bacteroidales bacterium]